MQSIVQWNPLVVFEKNLTCFRFDSDKRTLSFNGRERLACRKARNKTKEKSHELCNHFELSDDDFGVSVSPSRVDSRFRLFMIMAFGHIDFKGGDCLFLFCVEIKCDCLVKTRNIEKKNSNVWSGKCAVNWVATRRSNESLLTHILIATKRKKNLILSRTFGCVFREPINGTKQLNEDDSGNKVQWLEAQNEKKPLRRIQNGCSQCKTLWT